MKIKYSIEEIEKVGHPKVPLASFLIFDPISTRLAWIIVNFTKIRSIQITCLGFLAGLSSAWCFFQGVPPYLALGAFLFGLAAVLDWSDGKIAKVKKKGSAVGAFLDGSLDQFFMYLSIFALAYGQFRINNQGDFLLLGAGIILLWFAIYLFGIKREQAEDFYMKKEQKLKTGTNRYSFLGKVKKIKDCFEKKRLIPLFTNLEAATLILIIGPIFNVIKGCFILAFFLSFLMFFLYLIVNIIHLSRLPSKDDFS